MPTPLHLSNAHPSGRADVTGQADSAPGLRPEQLFAKLERFPKNLELRSLRPEDRIALMRTVDRCTPATRQDRFHEPISALPLGWARRMCRVTPKRVAVGAVVEAVQHRLFGSGGAALGAPCDDEIVALAQIEQEDGGAELAVLVEDSYHRLGLGRVVVMAALIDAAKMGVTTVHAHLLPGNEGIRRLLTSLELPVVHGHDDGKERWSVDISEFAVDAPGGTGLRGT